MFEKPQENGIVHWQEVEHERLRKSQGDILAKHCSATGGRTSRRRTAKEMIIQVVLCKKKRQTSGEKRGAMVAMLFIQKVEAASLLKHRGSSLRRRSRGDVSTRRGRSCWQAED